MLDSVKARILLLNLVPEAQSVIERGLESANVVIAEKLSNLENLNRLVKKHVVDMLVIVIDTDIEKMIKTVKQLVIEQPLPIAVFTHNPEIGLIQPAIKAGVNAYMIDGLSKVRIMSALETARVCFAETQSLRQELEKTRVSLEQRKLIERAKGIIMQRSEINEEEAYKAMRAMAMNKNMKIIELAKSVISAAELIT